MPIHRILFGDIKYVIIGNGPRSWLFCWFLSPSFGNHECTYTCMYIAILCLKVEQKQVCVHKVLIRKNVMMLHNMVIFLYSFASEYKLF